MSELFDDRTLERAPEPEHLAIEYAASAAEVAPQAHDSVPSVTDANAPEPSAFEDFWGDNFMLVPAIALVVLLGLLAAIASV